MKRNFNLKLYIYNYIKCNGTVPKDILPSKVSYYTRQLLAEGYILKEGYGVWKITNKELQKKVQRTDKKSETAKVRSHAYRYKISIPYLNNWLDRRTFMDKHVDYRKIPGGEKVTVRKHSVHLHDNCIIVIFYRGKSFRVRTAKEGDSWSLLELKKTLASLERKMRTSFKFGHSYKIHCFSKHHANIRNAMAKYYQARGINKFSIKDEDGKEWLIMDDSFNLAEVETVNAKSATRDHDLVVAPLMNKLRKNPYILNDLEERNNEMSKKMSELLDIMKILVNNVEIQSKLSLSNTEQIGITAKQIEAAVRLIQVPPPKLNPDDKSLADYFG